MCGFSQTTGRSPTSLVALYINVGGQYHTILPWHWLSTVSRQAFTSASDSLQLCPTTFVHSSTMDRMIFLPSIPNKLGGVLALLLAIIILYLSPGAQPHFQSWGVQFLVLLPFYRQKLDRSSQFGADCCIIRLIKKLCKKLRRSIPILGRSGPPDPPVVVSMSSSNTYY